MNILFRVILAILSFLGVGFFCVIGVSYLPKTDLVSMLIGVGFMFLAILCMGLFGYVTITLSEKKTPVGENIQ
jgi:hypothetical protein